MEYTNKNEMYHIESCNTDIIKIDLLNHVKKIRNESIELAESQPEVVKPKSELGRQMEGLSFEEQKEMLNKMAVSRSTIRINEYVGKRYSLEQIKALDVSVSESVRILINEAAVSPRMDMKSVTVMVEDFHKSRKEDRANQNIAEKTSHKKFARV